MHGNPFIWDFTEQKLQSNTFPTIRQMLRAIKFKCFEVKLYCASRTSVHVTNVPIFRRSPASEVKLQAVACTLIF